MSLFSERLKALRRQRGFKNQKALADKLGIKQQTVSEYEKGGRDPLPPILIKMAETLNTTVDYLVGRTDNPEPPLNLTPEERAILGPLLLRLREQGSLTVDEITNFWLDDLPKDPGLDDFGKA